MPLYTNHCDHPKDDYYGVCKFNQDSSNNIEEDRELLDYDVYFTFGDATSPWESADETERLNPANWSYCARWSNEDSAYASGSVLHFLWNDRPTMFRHWMQHVGMIVESDHEKARRLSHH